MTWTSPSSGWSSPAGGWASPTTGGWSALAITRYSASDRSLTDGSSPPTYGALTTEPGLVDGSPVGRAVFRDALATVTTRPTVALSTDLKVLRMEAAPPADVRGTGTGGGLQQSLLSAGDLYSGQYMYGSLLDAAGDCTLVFWMTPNGVATTGRVIEWDNETDGAGDGVAIQMYTAGTKWRVYTASGGTQSGIILQDATAITTGTEYMVALTYETSTGAMTIRVYDGATLHSSDLVGTAATGLDFSHPHRIGAGKLAIPCADIRRLMTFDSVLDGTALDALAATPSNVGALRDYHGIYTGCYDAADPTTLYYATGSGYPVRAGTHPGEGVIGGLTGQSNAIGGSSDTWVIPANYALGNWRAYDTPQYAFDTTPGDDNPGLEQWLIGEDHGAPGRGIWNNGVAGTTIAQQITTYGPALRGYFSAAGITPAFVIFWHGESSADDSPPAADYEDDLETYCDDWETAYPGIVILIVELVTINDGTDSTRTEHATIRAAQATVAAVSSTRVLIDTSDITIANGHVAADGVHVLNSGMAIVAGRIETELVSRGVWTS